MPAIRRIVIAAARSDDDVLHVGKQVTDAHDHGQPICDPERADSEVLQHQAREIQEREKDRAGQQDNRTVLFQRIFECCRQQTAEGRGFFGHRLAVLRQIHANAGAAKA